MGQFRIVCWQQATRLPVSVRLRLRRVGNLISEHLTVISAVDDDDHASGHYGQAHEDNDAAL